MSGIALALWSLEHVLGRAGEKGARLIRIGGWHWGRMRAVGKNPPIAAREVI